MNPVSLHINLTVEQLIEAAVQLSPQDKLRLSDAIWDDSYEIPESQKQVVLARIREIEQDPSQLLDWDEVADKF